MCDKQNQPFQLSFNASLKVDFQGSRVSSDGGLILVRELNERLGLGELIAPHLTNSRRGAALTFRLQSFETDLLAQEENLAGLAAINRELIAKAGAIDSPQRVVFRADAAFAKPEICGALEERGVKYAIRIPANDGRERTSRSC